MRAIVAYESLFGNTQQIAFSVAEGLRERLEVELVEIRGADPAVEGIDLLVVGGPTHMWGMSRRSTREDARKHAAKMGKQPAAEGAGVRDWLRRLRTASGCTVAAAFDTAMRKTGWLPYGSAARREASFLNDKGYRLIAEPEQFIVTGIEGPLEQGEVERARAWGARLAADLTAKHDQR